MPNIIGGDIALLSESNIATEQAWTNSQMQIETDDVQSETFDTLLENQQKLGDGFVTKLTDANKDYDVKVNWIDFCGTAATDGDTEVCADIDETPAPGKEKQYSIGQTVKVTYSVDESELAGSFKDKAEVLAKTQKNAFKELVQRLNLKSDLFLNANIGYNAGNEFAKTGTTSNVPEAEYNVSLAPRIMKEMLYNKVPNAFIVDGGTLYLPITNAGIDGANGEGKGNATRSKIFKTTVDIHGMAGAGLSDCTFAVAPYSYAFVSKNYYKNRKPVYDPDMGTGKWKYSVPIPKYGIRADVVMQRKCIDGTKDRFKYVFVAKIHYEFLVNPEGCTVGGNTINGIWKYKLLPAA